MEPFFKPKSFEYFRTKTIYDFVGIRIYKKYLPFTGDLARKWGNKSQLKFDATGITDELHRYERETRKNEIRHIFGLLLCIILILIVDKKLSLFDIVFLSVLNLFINIYPIFLQRYNRIRIVNLLLSKGLKSPYK